MAYFYVITNLINQKQYVGKTIFTIEKRWKEHLIDAKNNGLYVVHCIMQFRNKESVRPSPNGRHSRSQNENIGSL